MGIYKGSTEVEMMYKGSTELANAYKGAEEIWSNAIGSVYDLGTAKTFSIPSLLPGENYQQLTADNFYAISQSASRSQSQSPTGGRNPSFSIIDIHYTTPSYNASTGALTYSTYQWGRPGNSDYGSSTTTAVHVVVFIPGSKNESSPRFLYKVRKIVDLGYNSGSALNIKNVCSGWKKVTTNNLLIKDWSGANTSADGSDHSNTVSTTKTYNNTTGIATCYQYSSYNGAKLSTHVYLLY